MVLGFFSSSLYHLACEIYVYGHTEQQYKIITVYFFSFLRTMHTVMRSLILQKLILTQFFKRLPQFTLHTHLYYPFFMRVVFKCTRSSRADLSTIKGYSLETDIFLTSAI